jgi:hypothetical protein
MVGVNQMGKYLSTVAQAIVIKKKYKVYFLSFEKIIPFKDWSLLKEKNDFQLLFFDETVGCFEWLLGALSLKEFFAIIIFGSLRILFFML